MIDNLGDRMKEYESVSQHTFIKRMPVIIRLDGKNFSKYTKSFKVKTPLNIFSMSFHFIMLETMKFLCKNIQNVRFAYTQSDEISLLLCDWNTHETQQCFGGKQSKIESISASLATAIFNREALEYSNGEKSDLAMFDSRAFNLPKEEVTNYFIWRQKDAIRNSINNCGQFHFSPKRLNGLTTTEVKDLLLREKSFNWNDLQSWEKRGSCYKNSQIVDSIPIFTEDRTYIEECLIGKENETAT